MPKAIIVSSFFPPLNSAGSSIRLVKLIKHLPDWTFVVFTQDVERTVVAERKLSSFLLEELPADLTVRRVPAPFSLANVPGQKGVPGPVKRSIQKLLGDSSLLWGLRTFWKAWSEMRRSHFDVIFGVTPPFTNALTVMLLGWVSRRPFVLDMKDDWVGSGTFLQRGGPRQKFEIILESLVVRSASAIITVTAQSQQLYRGRYKHLRQPDKFHLIPNGCDLDEYEDLKSRERTIVSSRFLILSAAWGYRKGYRDLAPFLWALDVFFKRCPEARDRVEVVLLGDSLSADYDDLIADLNLDKIILRAGAARRNEFVEWLWKADLFLLVQPFNNTTSISGTLYEYWATGKAPILLISEQGASSALVQGHGIGRHFHFAEVEQAAAYIENVYSAYTRGQPVWIERAGVQNFDRKLVAQRVGAIFREVADLDSRL